MIYHGRKKLKDFGITKKDYQVPQDVNTKRPFDYYTYDYGEHGINSYGLSVKRLNEIRIAANVLEPSLLKLVVWHEYLHLTLPIYLDLFSYNDFYTCFPSIYDVTNINDYTYNIFKSVSELCVIITSVFSEDLNTHTSNIQKWYKLDPKDLSILKKVRNLYFGHR